MELRRKAATCRPAAHPIASPDRGLATSAKAASGWRIRALKVREGRQKTPCASKGRFFPHLTGKSLILRKTRTNSSESGLFNRLRAIPNKNFLLHGVRRRNRLAGVLPWIALAAAVIRAVRTDSERNRSACRENVEFSETIERSWRTPRCRNRVCGHRRYSTDGAPRTELTAPTNALTSAERGRWRGKNRPNRKSGAGRSGREAMPRPDASLKVKGSSTLSPSPCATSWHANSADDVSIVLSIFNPAASSGAQT